MPKFKTSPASLPLSQKAQRTREQPISFLMAAAVGNPNLISFAAGLVDYDTLPLAEAHGALSKILSDPVRARRALQYGTTHGDPELRQALLEHQCRLDEVSPTELGLAAEDVVITTGSQQALYLIADVLLDPGDIAITANPSYFVYTGLLQSFGADVRTVPMDEGGMIVESAEALLAALEESGELAKVKLFYCQSYYQNPTGLTLCEDRRQKLANLVREYGRRAGRRILLLEDAAYRELGFDSEKILPSLKRFDPDNDFVATSYTFSKPFSPGVKTGYCFLPNWLVDPVLQQKGNHDFGSPNLCQALLRQAILSGDYQRHLQVVRDGYRRRRDMTLTALQRHLGDVPGISWTKPTGGLYVWLTLPEPVDTGWHGTLYKAARGCDVLYVPGAFCCQAGANGRVGSNQMRLCHATVPLDKIEEGIARLARCIKEQLESTDVQSSSPSRPPAVAETGAIAS